jgi:hypothetical protein
VTISAKLEGVGAASQRLMPRTNDLNCAIFSLEPVTFRYKKEIDPAGTSQFGLIAEEVAKVNSALVLPDKEGKPYTVRDDQVNAMLLKSQDSALYFVEPPLSVS